MRIEKKKTFTVQRLAFLLLAINILAGYSWIFGLHTIRLFSHAFSGVVLLLLMYNYKTTKATFPYKTILFILIVLGIVRNFSTTSFVNLLTDFSTLGIISSVILLKDIKFAQMKQGILFIVITSIIVFVYTIPLMDFTFVGNLDYDREVAFNSFGDQTTDEGASVGYIIYSTQQIVASSLVIFLLLMPLINNRTKKFFLITLIALSVGLIIVYSSYYQKRQSFTELFLIIILSATYNRKLLKGLLPKNIMLSILIAIMILFTLISSDLFSGLINRFTDQAEDINKFDRLEESEYLLSTFNLLDWVIGKGFGFTSEATVSGSMLHLGYGNLLMKGGIALLLVYLIGTFKNIAYCIKMGKIYPEFYIGVSISIFSLIQLSYSPGYHWIFSSIVTGLAMFSRYPLNSIVLEKYGNYVDKNVIVRFKQ